MLFSFNIVLSGFLLIYFFFSFAATYLNVYYDAYIMSKLKGLYGLSPKLRPLDRTSK